jgi:acyl-CoA thioesterase-1
MCSVPLASCTDFDKCETTIKGDVDDFSNEGWVMKRNGWLRRDFNLSALSAGLLGTLSLGTASAPTATVLVLGDSLSAEYGIPRGKGWVALLADKLHVERPDVRVVNASISGDTTAGGRSRLPALLDQVRPMQVVIELGGNDALRGLDLNSTQNNLEAMIQACRAVNARVVLVGMQIPPNYGPDYSAKFSVMFANLAKKYHTGLVPFFLKGIADAPDATAQFQPDRIHPKEEVHPRMLANVWPEIKKNL